MNNREYELLQGISRSAKKTLPIDLLLEMIADAYFKLVTDGSAQPDKDALFVVWLTLVGMEYGFKAPRIEQDTKATEQKSKINARSQMVNSAKSKKALSDDMNFERTGENSQTGSHVGEAGDNES